MSRSTSSNPVIGETILVNSLCVLSASVVRASAGIFLGIHPENQAFMSSLQPIMLYAIHFTIITEIKIEKTYDDGNTIRNLSFGFSCSDDATS